VGTSLTTGEKRIDIADSTIILILLIPTVIIIVYFIVRNDYKTKATNKEILSMLNELGVISDTEYKNVIEKNLFITEAKYTEYVPDPDNQEDPLLDRNERYTLDEELTKNGFIVYRIRSISNKDEDLNDFCNAMNYGVQILKNPKNNGIDAFYMGSEGIFGTSKYRKKEDGKIYMWSNLNDVEGGLEAYFHDGSKTSIHLTFPEGEYYGCYKNIEFKLEPSDKNLMPNFIEIIC